MFKGSCDYCGTGEHGLSRGCDHCRIGCFNPARMRNPFFGTKFGFDEHFWWRGMYCGVEWLCADCYDDMVSEMREMEDIYREHQGKDFKEDPEFTRILEGA